MSFSYEKLTENCIFHLLDANQHRGVYIDREFSAEKTRTGGNIVVPFTFYFFTACHHTLRGFACGGGVFAGGIEIFDAPRQSKGTGAVHDAHHAGIKAKKNAKRRIALRN